MNSRFASKILKQALNRAMRNNPAYSMRALAKKLGVSAPYLSRILNGEKAVPETRFEALTNALVMDESARRRLREAMLRDSVKDKRVSSSFLNEVLAKGGGSAQSKLGQYTEGSLNEQSLLEPWFKVAMLDLVDCVDFRPEPAWIAQRLGIREADATAGFDELRRFGMIAESAGRWIKVESKLRFPTSRSHPSIRRYHKKMIETALSVLLHQTADEDFQKRMITGVSFSANPANLPRARERLQEMLFELAELLATGECTEVYQLNAQLFSLTQPKPKRKQ